MWPFKEPLTNIIRNKQLDNQALTGINVPFFTAGNERLKSMAYTPEIYDKVSSAFNTHISFHDDLKVYDTDYEYIGAEDFEKTKQDISNVVGILITEARKQGIQEGIEHIRKGDYLQTGLTEEDIKRFEEIQRNQGNGNIRR